MCSYRKDGMTVSVRQLPEPSIIRPISLSLSPITFWPFTSSKLWSVRSPFRAADESLTRLVIQPFLKVNPTWPKLSLCIVMVLSKGLKNRDKSINKIISLCYFLYLSLTATRMLLRPAFLNSLCTLSIEYPATFSPLICSIWSPNRNPAIAAGEPDCTRLTKMPLEMA